MSSRLFALWSAVVWTLLVLSSCLLPGQFVPSFDLLSFIQWDKLAHFVIFWILALLWSNYFALGYTANRRPVITFILCVGLGIGIEFIQRSGAVNRNFEYADIVADTLGALLGVLWWTLNRKIYVFVKNRLPFVN